MMRKLAALPVLLLLAACTTMTPAATSTNDASCTFKPSCAPAPPVYNPTPAQTELDNIYTYLAYAVVYKNWQTSEDDSSRGYNIGSVLVNEKNSVVCWGVNSIIATGNNTQHGEVRLLTNYLGNTRQRRLEQYVVYTTLEPCAMCSGTMTLLSVKRTVWGQRDPDFGDAIQRLTLNSKPSGYCPYPRGVISVEARNDITQAIDQTYCRAYDSISLTAWLASADARALYKRANDRLATYHVTFPENQPFLDEAQKFLAGVPSTFVPIPYAANCPP
jgi:tRNA(Arg) A34 adenosine deaminase TadA